MGIEPDIAGFADAQQRLREGFGEAIDFLWPAQVTVPPNIPTDPDTGAPYDPMVASALASAATVATASAKCNVVFHAIGRLTLVGEAQDSALGITPKTHIMLITDWANRTRLSGAITFIARDERYEVTAMKEDGVGQPHQRFLIYGRRE